MTLNPSRTKFRITAAAFSKFRGTALSIGTHSMNACRLSGSTTAGRHSRLAKSFATVLLPALMLPLRRMIMGPALGADDGA